MRDPPEDSRAKSAEPDAAARRLLQSAPIAPRTPASPPAPVQAPAPSAAPAKEGQLSSIPTRPADELYSTGLRDLSRQSYDRAIDNLRTFIQQNPQDARVPNARLRLADAYVAQQRYKEAIPEYEALARELPESPLVPAAVYGQAQARLALGDRAGCKLLHDLLDRYPQSPEATLAHEPLSTRCP